MARPASLGMLKYRLPKLIAVSPEAPSPPTRGNAAKASSAASSLACRAAATRRYSAGLLAPLNRLAQSESAARFSGM